MKNFTEVIEQSRASIEKADLGVLLPLVASINPKAILEVGMHRGYSMEIWRKAFDPILVGLEKDPPTPDAYLDKGALWSADSHDETTLDKVLLVLDEKYDFLFIDGDHSYEGVKKDFEMYSPLVRRGGIIAFHDAVYHADKTEEVDILWQEIKQKYPFVEIKVGKNSTGIGVIFV